MNWILLLFFTVILLFGVVVLVLIISRGKQTSVLNIDKYRSAWLKIEQQLKRDDASSYMLVVVNADKLLDLALKERGFKGETMGERMKSATSEWSNRNAVWASHKLRNRLVHETDIAITYNESRQSIAGFKQALKDLGAI